MILSLLAATVLAAQPRLAVLDVKPRLGVTPDLVQALTDALTAEVRKRNPDAYVVGAGEIRAMLEVQRTREKAGCTEDVGCLAEVGGALGAEHVVSSTLSKLGDTYLLTVQLLDVHHARVVHESAQRLGSGDAGALLTAVERAVADVFPESAIPPPPPSPSVRASIVYEPEIPLTGGTLGLTTVLHDIGLELSAPLGATGRYHLLVAYATAAGISGARIEPLAFGLVLTLLRKGDLQLEVEPIASFLDVVFGAGNNSLGQSDVDFLFSASLSAQINLTYKSLYVFASPVGLELRYLEIDTAGLNDGSNGLIGSADLSYRLRLGVGYQF